MPVHFPDFVNFFFNSVFRKFHREYRLAPIRFPVSVQPNKKPALTGGSNEGRADRLASAAANREVERIILEAERSVVH